MKRRITLLSLFCAVVIYMVPSVSALVFGPGASANGHANLTIGGENRTFSFSANTRKNGTVSGNVTLQARQTDTFIHADINCMVVSGNTATMSGPITNSSDETLEGLTGIFKVEDNGEGANAPADRLSLYQPFAPNTTFDCTIPFNPPMLESEGGNIQVKP